MDTATLVDTGAIAGLIVLIVQVFALPYIPEGPKQNNMVRGIAVLLGAILVPVTEFAIDHQVVTSGTLAAAIEQGIGLGATVTFAVAAAKTAVAKAPTPPSADIGTHP